MFDNVFIFHNSFFNFCFGFVLHANQKILGCVVHVIKNGLVPSQIFIPSWKELFKLRFKGGPTSLISIYSSAPVSFHPFSLTVLSVWRRAAACGEVLTPNPGSAGSICRSIPSSVAPLTEPGTFRGRHGQRMPSATGMDRLFLAAWAQGIRR